MKKPSRIVVKKSVILQKMGGRYVAYDNSTAQLHEINETGAFIIEQIKKKKEENDIIKALINTYDVSKHQATMDYKKFIESLSQKGIVQNK